MLIGVLSDTHGLLRPELLTALAGVGDNWGLAMGAVVVGLWILWGINYFGSGQHAAGSSTSTQQIGG